MNTEVKLIYLNVQSCIEKKHEGKVNFFFFLNLVLISYNIFASVRL